MKTEVPGNTRNKLRVKVIKNLFTVSFNDQKLHEKRVHLTSDDVTGN
jgi:hypothetical protein